MKFIDVLLVWRDDEAFHAGDGVLPVAPPLPEKYLMVDDMRFLRDDRPGCGYPRFVFVGMLGTSLAATS